MVAVHFQCLLSKISTYTAPCIEVRYCQKWQERITMEDLDLCYWLMHIVHKDHDFEVVDWKYVNFDFSKTTVLFVKVKSDDDFLDVYGFWDLFHSSSI